MVEYLYDFLLVAGSFGVAIWGIWFGLKDIMEDSKLDREKEEREQREQQIGKWGDL